MKILDTPRSGKCGQTVAFQSRFGLCLRQYAPQKAALTPARERVCAVFGNNSRKWGAKLGEEQRDRWALAGAQVMSHPRLAQKGPLTGQQLWQAISSVRATVGLPETLEIPVRPVFAQSNVGRLEIENGADGARLYLAVSGELNEDIMVFGQEPCSRGRYKRRNVSYLGLLPPPIGGQSEITRLYQAKFGEPRPGQKVFVVTCQEKDGWKGLDLETSATVPERPEELQATANTASSQFPYMHTGCTGDADRTSAPVVGYPQASAETGDGGETLPERLLRGRNRPGRRASLPFEGVWARQNRRDNSGAPRRPKVPVHESRFGPLRSSRLCGEAGLDSTAEARRAQRHRSPMRAGPVVQVNCGAPRV